MRRTRLMRSAVTVTLVVTMGCTTWKSVGFSRAIYIEANEPELVRLHLVDQAVVVRDHRVQGDSIVGTKEARVGGADVREPFAVAASVERMDLGAFSAPRTALTVLAIAGVVLGALGLLFRNVCVPLGS